MVIVRVVLILLAFVVVLVLALTNSQTLTNAVVFNKTYYDVPVAFVMLYSFAFGALCVGRTPAQAVCLCDDGLERLVLCV